MGNEIRIKEHGKQKDEKRRWGGGGVRTGLELRCCGRD